MIIAAVVVPTEDLKQKLFVATPISDTIPGMARFMNKFDNYQDFWWLWSDGEDIQKLTDSYEKAISETAEVVFEYNPWLEVWQVRQPGSRLEAFRSWMSVQDFLKFYTIPTEEIRRVCPLCHKAFKMSLTTDEWHALTKWNQGESKIQDAIPKFKPVERDWIRSGYCPKCQDLIGLNPDGTDRISIV